MKIATVFSGIGAAEQALKQLGVAHEIVFACDNGERDIDVDIETIKLKTSKMNVNESREYINSIYDSLKKTNYVKKSYFENYDITSERWFEDIRFLNGNYFTGKVDLIVGGSPCQSFSTYGKRGGLEDTRGTLFYEYARIIKEVSPKFFIYENVTGLLNHDKGRTWSKIKEVFNQLHYDIKYDVLDSQYYNLPQMRKRLFVVGVRHDLKKKEFNFPKPEDLKISSVSLLDNYVDDKYYLGYKGFRYVTDKKRNEGRARVNRDVIGCQTANQQFNWTGDFRVEVPRDSHVNSNRIFIGDYNGVPSVARKLTPHECLRLMGFKDFKVVVPDQIMYRQVGNSIAVPVLKKIIENIIKL